VPCSGQSPAGFARRFLPLMAIVGRQAWARSEYVAVSNRRDLRQLVLDNFDWDKLQHNRGSQYPRVRPEELFQLLNDTSGRVRTISTHLLPKLATRSWYIHMGVHEGGSDPRAPLHITIMAPRGIHVNVRQRSDDTLYVYEITEE
jgi:hypothetical protein